MCKQNQNPNAAPKEEQKPEEQKAVLDRDIQMAGYDLQQAQIRANIEFNNSPAGQMMRQFETYQRIAKPLSESKFVPAQYQGNIGDCTIAVEMAARLGVFPLTVMQNLCIVKGNPTWKSKFLIACINTCGRYTTLDYHFDIDGNVGDIKYKTWQKDPQTGRNTEVLKTFEYPMLDNLTCVAFATEKATGRLLESPAVSIRMAIMEGWYTKDGSKWPSMPELMLRYRAASYWVSTFAPEISMGFRTEEEERDIVDVDYEDVTETTNQRPRSIRPASMEEAKEKLRKRDQQKPNQITKPEMP